MCALTIYVNSSCSVHSHKDFLTWERFLQYKSPVHFPYVGSRRRSFDIFSYHLRQTDERKQLRCRWLQNLWWSSDANVRPSTLWCISSTTWATWRFNNAICNMGNIRKLIGNMVQKYFSARNIFFPQEIFFSARNIFFSARNIFFPREINFSPQEINFSPQEIYFFPQEIFFSARNIFFRKKYFSPQEIYFSPQDIYFSARNKFFSARNIFFSARNIFFHKKYFSSHKKYFFWKRCTTCSVAQSVSLARASCWGGVWKTQRWISSITCALWGSLRRRLERWEMTLYSAQSTKKRLTKLTCQMYGGPEGTSLHKFFIALHKFWLVWKIYYVIMYT